MSRMELYIWLLVFLVCILQMLYVGVDEVLIFIIRCKCFEYLLESIELVSLCNRIFIANISVVKQGPVIACGFGCLRRIPLFTQTYLFCDNPVIRRHPLSEKYASQLKMLLIHFLWGCNLFVLEHYFRWCSSIVFPSFSRI